MHMCTITRKRFFTFHNEVWGGPIFGGNGYGWGMGGGWGGSQFSESISV